MSMLQRIDTELKEAMKSSDKLKVSTLRMIKASVKNLEIENGRSLSDDDIVDLLTTLAKQRKESITGFEKGGRTDLADKERQELGIIQEYLPSQLSVEELRGLISETISETGASNVKDMGMVMKAVMPMLKGRADGKVVNQIVKEMLGGS